MSEENKEAKVLIEETDIGRHRRENPEPEPPKKKKKVSAWLIAIIAVVLVGIVAGLAVYAVQQKQKNDAFERMVSVTTDKVTLKPTTEEEDFEIEDSDDIVIAGDDAIGGDLEDETETTTGKWTTSEDEDSDDDEDSDADDKTTKKTTKRTTRRTTQWDAQQAAEDFWNEVSKWAR